MNEFLAIANALCSSFMIWQGNYAIAALCAFGFFSSLSRLHRENEDD